MTRSSPLDGWVGIGWPDDTPLAESQLGGVDSPADDPRGKEADDRARRPRGRVLRVHDRLGVAADVEAANPPRVERGDVVDDERRAPFMATLRNFWLLAMSRPPMSIASWAALK